MVILLPRDAIISRVQPRDKSKGVANSPATALALNLDAPPCYSLATRKGP